MTEQQTIKSGTVVKYSTYSDLPCTVLDTIMTADSGRMYMIEPLDLTQVDDCDRNMWVFANELKTESDEPLVATVKTYRMIRIGTGMKLHVAFGNENSSAALCCSSGKRAVLSPHRSVDLMTTDEVKSNPHVCSRCKQMIGLIDY